jgi:hypothetical protein
MQGEFDEKEFEFVRETGGEKSRIGSWKDKWREE